MALDFDPILQSFVDIAKDGVGSSLSLIGPTGGKFPAVIKARQGGTKPDYPYIQLDLVNVSETSGWLLGEGVDDLGQSILETQYKLTFQYTVYGGNAMNIAHNLHQYFRLDTVLGKVENDTTGLVEELFSVSSIPSTLSTNNLEVSRFNFTFNITDRFTDVSESIGVFDTININGEVKRDEKDIDPLTFIISVN